MVHLRLGSARGMCTKLACSQISQCYARAGVREILRQTEPHLPRFVRKKYVS
jgi:hypothetical protein